jgi:hypothetical protein
MELSILNDDDMLTRTTLRTTTLAIFVAALLHSSVPSDALQSPFSGLSGSWSGGGFIKLASGQRERLRCRATYGVTESDTRLQQRLRCASYRFDVDSNIVSEGGALHGTWTETSRNASGNVSGRVSGGEIQARIDGAGFSARLTLNTRGDRQSVVIESPGHDITESLCRARQNKVRRTRSPHYR